MSNLFVHIDLLAVVFLDISIRQQAPTIRIDKVHDDNKFSAMIMHVDHESGQAIQSGILVHVRAITKCCSFL